MSAEIRIGTLEQYHGILVFANDLVRVWLRVLVFDNEAAVFLSLIYGIRVVPLRHHGYFDAIRGAAAHSYTFGPGFWISTLDA